MAVAMAVLLGYGYGPFYGGYISTPLPMLTFTLKDLALGSKPNSNTSDTMSYCGATTEAWATAMAMASVAWDMAGYGGGYGGYGYGPFYGGYGYGCCDHGTMEDTGLDAAEILPWKPNT
ncbi:Baculoviral Iap Repeat-Containing Protein 6 [Manis pentadactyla]|nr:Baculoviral Iap Repeat-Containing Protein 6 [Manis pentadactyla]